MAIINTYNLFNMFNLNLKLCLATATHNFEWLKMYVICEI